mmetsp:Transcript_20006/g.64983  ORF Transcript_20006/g.64983 Transcript_20006/m.64983 type:complete len:203 (-) Transcript_20006:319-927(-)
MTLSRSMSGWATPAAPPQARQPLSRPQRQRRRRPRTRPRHCRWSTGTFTPVAIRPSSGSARQYHRPAFPLRRRPPRHRPPRLRPPLHRRVRLPPPRLERRVPRSTPPNSPHAFAARRSARRRWSASTRGVPTSCGDMVKGNTAYARTSPPATLMPHLLARSPPGLPTLVSRPRAAHAQRIRIRDRTDGAAEPRTSAEGGTGE